VRKTSKPTSTSVIDEKGQKQQHPIPAESILLFPVRAKHFNEKFWDHPHRFDPTRFNLSLAVTADQKN